MSWCNINSWVSDILTKGLFPKFALDSAKLMRALQRQCTFAVVTCFSSLASEIILW